jgi:hypothetical protein
MTTEYTEWQRPLSGKHFIMMEKLAQAGEVGDAHTAHPPPLTISTITYNVVVYTLAEMADTPLFLLYSLCTLW